MTASNARYITTADNSLVAVDSAILDNTRSSILDDLIAVSNAMGRIISLRKSYSITLEEYNSGVESLTQESITLARDYDSLATTNGYYHPFDLLLCSWLDEQEYTQSLIFDKIAILRFTVGQLI